MRTKISNKNIKYYIRQEYGFTSTKQLFEQTEHHQKLRNKVLQSIIQEFTGYYKKGDRLVTYNPYTNAFEKLNIRDFKHIATEDDLIKELSTLHKTRMAMLEESRKKMIELSKLKNRDKDLEAEIEKRSIRKQELQNINKNRDNQLNIEQ